ncbi:MAG: LPS-assembly protein LptD [Microscillaceae bacterium]|nr:LPS-assembly protein LptD [Microscillaceae bacterium]
MKISTLHIFLTHFFFFVFNLGAIPRYRQSWSLACARPTRHRVGLANPTLWRVGRAQAGSPPSGIYRVRELIYKALTISILTILFNFTFTHSSLAQNPINSKNKIDSLQTKKTTDTIKVRKEGDFKTTIEYTAKDSIITDALTEEIYLYGDAEVNYGDIKLKAAQIYINQREQEVTARGLRDSTGRLRGRPVFTQGSDNYESDSMRYNFKSEKAVVSGIDTKQGDGFVHGDKSKRGANGEMYAGGGRYTTCNLSHPHWYIKAGKIKMIPEKQVVSGPFNLVIADVPTPLGFFLGIFPVTQTKRSGIIVPTYGEVQDRGFYLRNGGYYWAINENMAAEFLGEIYTNGSWGFNTNYSYLKRYRFSGSAAIQYNRRIVGDGETRQVFNDFWIRWSHSPQPRGRSSFSANVNFGSSRFNQRNSFDPNRQLSSNFNSAITYSTSFNVGSSMVTLSLNARQDQNAQTNVMNVTLPEFNLGVNRIYPFKVLGNKIPNALKQINISYRATGLVRFSNQARTTAGLPFTRIVNLPPAPEPTPVVNPVTGQILQGAGTVVVAPLDFNLDNFSEIAKNAQIGVVHNIPISTTLKIFRYFSLNPSFNYQETWYPKRLDYTYIESARGVRVDTVQGFSRVYTYSASAGLTTNIFGTFLFDKKRKGKYLQAIRHTIRPTIGWSYAPDLSADRYGFFRTLQVDSTGRIQSVQRFLGFEPGASVSTNQAGVINFSIQNIFEAKVKPKGDTSQPKKITLLDNVSFNGNYNLVQDSLKLSNISITARTRLFDMIDFNFGGNLEPYLRVPDNQNPQGRLVDRLAIAEGKGIGQLNNFNVALSMDLTPKTFKKATQGKVNDALNQRGNMGAPDAKRGLGNEEKRQLQNMQANPNDYVDFEIPWTLRLNYNLIYNKLGFSPSQIVQVINFNGDVSLTKTWKFGFSSGYDISNKRISFTNFDIYKDLHCWEMRFTINPFGTFQSWSFDINVKSSLLQDLKLSRRRTFYDRGLVR